MKILNFRWRCYNDILCSKISNALQDDCYRDCKEVFLSVDEK